MKSQQLRSLLQWVYCLDLDPFLKIFAMYDDKYARDLWRLSQSDFIKFYCKLDDSKSTKLLKAWEKRYGGGKMIEQSEMAARMLRIIAKVLLCDHNIPCEMNIYNSRTPTLETPKGNIVYFNSSGDFRLHHKSGLRHSTFRGPTDLINYFKG